MNLHCREELEERFRPGASGGGRSRGPVRLFPPLVEHGRLKQSDEFTDRARSDSFIKCMNSTPSFICNSSCHHESPIRNSSLDSKVLLGCSLAGDTGCCLVTGRGGGGPTAAGRGYCSGGGTKGRLRRHSWRRPTTRYGQSHVSVSARNTWTQFL